MLTGNFKRKMAAFGLFALPIGIVKIAATVLGGPSEAKAETALSFAPPPPPSVVTPAVELTAREQSAIDRIARLDEMAFGATPMLHARADGGPVVVNPTADPGTPEFRVNAIMASSTGNRALINGRSLKVGDEISGGRWLIIDINANTRSVTIQDPETGHTATGSVEGPGA